MLIMLHSRAIDGKLDHICNLKRFKVFNIAHTKGPFPSSSILHIDNTQRVGKNEARFILSHEISLRAYLILCTLYLCPLSHPTCSTGSSLSVTTTSCRDSTLLLLFLDLCSLLLLLGEDFSDSDSNAEEVCERLAKS